MQHGPKVYVPLVFLFVFLVLLMPKSGKFNYDYKKGSPWMYETLVAEFDFPVLKTPDQLQKEREAAASSVIPYYKYSENIASERADAVEQADLGRFNHLKPEIVTVMDTIYSKGVIAERPDFPDGRPEDEQVIYVQKDRRAAMVPPDEIYTIADARARLLNALRDVPGGCNADSLCMTAGIYDLIVPNLIFDQQTTDLVHEESVNYISPTSGVVTSG